MSTRFRRLTVLLLVVAGLLLVYLFDHGRSVEPEADLITVEETTDDAIHVSYGASTGTHEDQPEVSSTPSSSTVADNTTAQAFVDQRIASLVVAAESGDHWAACEVAAELKRCQQTLDGKFHLLEQDLEHRVGGADAASVSPEQLARLKRALDSLQQRRDACARVPARTFGSIEDYQFQAATAGNTHAMAQFAIGESSSMAELIADPARYARYHEYAPVFFEEALQAGEPLAAMAILTVDVDISNIYRGILPRRWRDPELVLAFTQRVAAELTRPPLASRSPPNAATSQADALYDRYFAESPAMSRYITSLQRGAEATRRGQPPEWSSERLNQLDDDHCGQLRQ